MSRSFVTHRLLYLVVALSGFAFFYEVAQLHAAPAKGRTVCGPVCKNIYDYKDCDFDKCYKFYFWDCQYCARPTAHCNSAVDALCEESFQYTYRGLGTSCTEVCPCEVFGVFPSYVESTNTLNADNFMNFGLRFLCTTFPGGDGAP